MFIVLISKYLEKPRSKTPTPYGSAPIADTLPLRSRTPVPTKTTTDNDIDIFSYNLFDRPAPIAQTEFSCDPSYQFNPHITSSSNTRDIRSTHTSSVRSKTPGPEFGSTGISSSYRADTMKPRSKTPTAYEFSSSTLPNRFENKFSRQKVMNFLT